MKKAPGDYAALLLMSKCQLAQEKYGEGGQYAEEAKHVYPGEAQAPQICAFVKMKNGRFDSAYEELKICEKSSASPNLTFYKGLCNDKMGRKNEAAAEYGKFLKVVKDSPQAKYALKRMIEWGNIKWKGYTPGSGKLLIVPGASDGL
jgi:tetratricopeptide (TPR) repeat protein